MEEKKKTRGLRKERTGIVVSNACDKTITVVVSRKARHKRYKKIVTISKKYYAHDEKNEAQKGDTVRIVETRPLSKLKRWRLAQITQKGE